MFPNRQGYGIGAGFRVGGMIEVMGGFGSAGVICFCGEYCVATDSQLGIYIPP